MDEICRLCCSSNYVNNHIFDEESALYLKMSLYLPIKVFKNDRLPQKICDKCSCKVNDFYQFCNETIEVQNRLRAVLMSTVVEIEDSIDLTLIKPSSPSSVVQDEPNTDTKPDFTLNLTQNDSQNVKTCDQSTQTQEEDSSSSTEVKERNVDVPFFPNVKIKEEPKVPDVKMEDLIQDCYDEPDRHSDSDNELLVTYQKKKRKQKAVNGETKKKKKNRLKDLETILNGTSETTPLSEVKIEVNDKDGDIKLETGKRPIVKTEPVEFNCCICFTQCYSRTEMLQHYKQHIQPVEDPPPPAPQPPEEDPLKCPRCQKRLARAEWAGHWLRHWQRDRRPLRCSLCQDTFRDHHQILRHGASQHAGEASGGAGAGSGEGAAGAGPGARYVCDLCPAAFPYMRCLLAHRTTEHPPHAARPLQPRCAICQRQFSHLNSLRRHLAAHSGERNFLCNVCGKALSSREHLKFHIRIHTGYKPNVCGVCGKGFVKKCNLTLHERVHSGEKPHVCSHCGKAFSQRSTLVIHERYHSGARPYACLLCNRAFVAKGLLSMHLKTTCI